MAAGRIRAVAGATLLKVALTGCTSGGKPSGSADSGGTVELTVLTFETPNLPATLWDAAIERVERKVPGMRIKKLVSPDGGGGQDMFADPGCEGDQ